MSEYRRVLQFDIVAGLDKFSNSMTEMADIYKKKKSEIEDDKVVLNAEGGAVKEALDYALDPYVTDKETGEAQTLSVLSQMQELPSALQIAMKTLVDGMNRSMGTLKSSVKMSSKEISESFDVSKFTNNIRFAGANIRQLVDDALSAYGLISTMSTQNVERLANSYDQISSLSNEAIRKIALNREGKMTDNELANYLLSSKSYSYIPETLKRLGFSERDDQLDALRFSILTTKERTLRRDSMDNFIYSGMEHQEQPVNILYNMPKSYRRGFLSAGRYVNDEKTPRSTEQNDREAARKFYRGIKEETINGNALAYNVAKATGLLLPIGGGEYKFAKEKDVINRPDMLDQFGGLVNMYLNRAFQGPTEHKRSVLDSKDENVLARKDNRTIREGRALQDLDTRKNASPYISEQYVKPKAAEDYKTLEGVDKNEYIHYTNEKHTNPELRIPDMISIPQLVAQKNENGDYEFYVSRMNENKKKVYSRGLNYNWQKEGVQESIKDEWIKIGRNPLVDRIIKMHASEGASFENNSFGWGFDKEGNAIQRAPLFIRMPLEDLFKQDRFGKLQFSKFIDENGQEKTSADYKLGSKEFIEGINNGTIKPILKTGVIDENGKEEEIAFRRVAGKIQGVGNAFFIRNDDYTRMMEEDGRPDLLNMLHYFNEVDQNGELIDPKTGKPFPNTKGTQAIYAKYYDSINKILSHSVPIEEFGTETPKAAIVNFKAFYKAKKRNGEGITPDNRRFDGGAFIDPSIYSSDFQARMGPAKFLAIRANYKQWIKDSGLAYTDETGRQRFYMPGMTADEHDYERFRDLQERYLNTKERNKMTEKETQDYFFLRDKKMVDVLSNETSMLLADTALKDIGQNGIVSMKGYDELVEYVKKKGQKSLFTNENKNVVDKDGQKYVELTSGQQTELLSLRSDPNFDLGLRLMKDTRGFERHKNFINAAYLSSTIPTPGLVEASMKNYIKAFEELSTPEGAIKRVFGNSGRNADRLRMDKTLAFTDPVISSMIQSEKSDLADAIMKGDFYLPGKADLLLAIPNLYDVLGVYGEDMTGKPISGDPASFKAKEGQRLIIAPTISGNGMVSFTRSPYAYGENFFASAEANKFAAKYGLSKNSAMFRIEDFYDLNTGDFDGDMVWAYNILKGSDDFKKYTEEVNERVRKRKEARKEIEEDKKAISGSHDNDPFAEAKSLAATHMRGANSIMPIGLGYKAGQVGRVVQLSLDKLAEMAEYGSAQYAYGVDSLKHAGLEEIAKSELVQKLIYSRKPYNRLVTSLFEEHDKGEYGSTDIFDYALPTFFDQIGIHTMALGKIMKNEVFAGYGSKIKKALDANIKTQYGTKSKEEYDLARWWGDLVEAKLTGTYQITSDEELAEGRRLIDDLRVKRNEYAMENPYATDRIKEFDDMIRSATDAINTESLAGFTQSNVRKGKVEQFYNTYHWMDPTKRFKFVDKEGATIAAALYDAEEKRRRDELLTASDPAVTEMISKYTGKQAPTNEEKENTVKQIYTATKHTGLNFSNSKYFTKENIKTLPGYYADYGDTHDRRFVAPVKYSGINQYEFREQDGKFFGKINGEEREFESEKEYYEEFKNAPREYTAYMMPEDASKNRLDFSKRATLDYFSKAEMKELDETRKRIARQILTGEQEVLPFTMDALVGTAAHEYLDTYIDARHFGPEETAMSHSEAKDKAYKVLKEKLFGVNGKLSEKEKAVQDSLGIHFVEHENGLITAEWNDKNTGFAQTKEGRDARNRINDKLEQASRVDGKRSRLDTIADTYLQPLIAQTKDENGNEVVTSRIAMAEGISFENGKRTRSKTENPGIFIQPKYANGEEVITLERYTEKDGYIGKKKAGMFFTPDMVKENEDGTYTVVDWKSSSGSHGAAAIQGAFYAHLLEQLGKQYWKDPTANPDLKEFGKFVKVDPNTGKMTSNITGVEGVSVFKRDSDKYNGIKPVFKMPYTEEYGETVANWLYTGMVDLQSSAAKGFIDLIGNQILTNSKRSAGGQRATDIDPNSLNISDENTEKVMSDIRAKLTNKFETNNEIAAGRTGVRDSDGNFIDNDKSFIVSKYWKDKEELEEVEKFIGKEQRKDHIYVGKTDKYTQQIEQLESKFSPEDRETIRHYGIDFLSDPDRIANSSDAARFLKDFDGTQQRAREDMIAIKRLRDQYVEKMSPESMRTDYQRILNSGESAASMFLAGQRKYNEDVSALEHYYQDYTGNDFGGLPIYENGKFRTEAADWYKEFKTSDHMTEDEITEANKNAQMAADRVKALLGENGEYGKKKSILDESHIAFNTALTSTLPAMLAKEGAGILQMFHGGNIESGILALRQQAFDYAKLAPTEEDKENRPEVETNIMNEFAARSLKLKGIANKYQEAKDAGVDTYKWFDDILKAEKDYKQENLDAIRHNKPISNTTKQRKAAFDYLKNYIMEHPEIESIDALKPIFDEFNTSYEADADKNREFQAYKQDSQLQRMKRQNLQQEAQLEHQYEQQNRNLWGPSRSRLVNAYRQQADMKWTEQQRYNTAVDNAKDTSRYLEIQKKYFKRDTGMSAEKYIEKYKNGGGDENKLLAANQILQSEEALRHYNETAKDAEAQMQKFKQPAMALRAGFQSIGDSVNMLVQRFGRRMFMKAIQEATQFVKQYDKTMTEIQMITLKSDTEMSKVGDGLISKAKEMKISITEISQSAATLYRQGLSDEEVDERLETISKFSKVSGTKVADATKLVTVAMNTGLVGNAEEAADIVTALGDNAATNAQQIEKGIEKAGAAAAADGTTFGQLAAMLTAITSTTQIGGNVAGRTLNTIFGRMNKIGTNELIYDENGNAVSGSAVAKLLKAQGINMYDEEGNKRSSFNVLKDLSEKWEGLSDAEQQQIANAIAGTRQYSNFAAIMQGMQEGKINEYMELIGESSGITNKKYDEVYTKSLEASLTDLKNAYDSLVNDLISSGVLTDFIDGIANIINGVDNLTNSVGGLGAMLQTVLPLIIGLTMLKAGISSANAAVAVAGVVVAGVGAAIASNNGKQVSDEQHYKNSINLINERYNSANTKIEKAKTLRDKGVSRTAEETKEYTELVSSLATMFNLSDPTKSINDFANSMDSVAAAAANATRRSQEYADVIDKANENNETERIRNLVLKSGDWALTSSEALSDYENARNKDANIDSKYLEDFFTTDENGNKTIDIKKFFDVATLGLSNSYGESEFQQEIGNAFNALGSLPGMNDFFDWATPGVRKFFGKNQDMNEYSWNKNKPRLAKLLSNAMSQTTTLDPDMFKQLQKANFGGYEEEDWSRYLDDIHAGKSMSTLPIEMLKKVMEIWIQENTADQDLIDQIKTDFSSEIKSIAPWLNEDQIEAMSTRAAQDVIGLKDSGLSYSVAYGSVLNDIFNLGSRDYSPDSIKASANNYLKKTSYNEYEPKIYKGDVYPSLNDAKLAQDTDYETYKTKNKIETKSYVTYDERDWSPEEAEDLNKKREKDREDFISKELYGVVEGSYKKNYIWYGQQRTEDEIYGMLNAYKESNKIKPGYAYINANGNPVTSANYKDVDDARYLDYTNMIMEAAQKAGVIERITKENNPGEILSAIIEWYESQPGNKTYDDFSEEHNIGPSNEVYYGGIPYANTQEAELALIEDFWSQVEEGEGYYEIDGKRYKNRSGAIIGAHDYLLKKFEEEHPIGSPTDYFAYNGEEYGSYELADEQRKKDFYEAEENTIRAATEEEVDNLDVLHAGVETGLSTWEQDKKNAYALRVDSMLRNMESAGVSDIESMREFLQKKGATDWKYLIENNGDLARLIDSIQYDKDGNIINPETYYDQVIKTLRESGKDFTPRFVSSSEKAKTALGMFEHVTSEEKGYLSIDDARAAAQIEYDRRQKEYEESIQKLTDKKLSETRGVDTDEYRQKVESRIREENPYNGPTVNQIAAGYRVYTEDEQTYLKESLGEQIYDRLMNGPATPEEKEYAKQLLENKAVGITSLTVGQQISGLKNLREEIIKGRKIGEDEGNYQTSIAAQYLSGWSNANEYLGLLSAKGTDEFEKLGGQKKLDELEQSLVNFQKNLEIKFKVEGISELENAGKILQGTSKLIENLQKEGTIKIKAKIEFDADIYNTEQLAAMLNGGVYTEQMAAMKQITGWSEERIANNTAEAFSASNEYINGKRDETARAYDEWYATDKEEALESANRNNYIIDEHYNDQTIQQLKDQGFDVDNNNLVTKDGKETTETQYWTDQLRQVHFVHSGLNGGVDTKSAFLDQSGYYFSPTEIAQAQLDIINGDLIAGAKTARDRALYQQASSSMGTYGSKYVSMRDQNERLTAIGQKGQYGETDLGNVETLAKEEANEAIRKARVEELQEKEAKGTVQQGVSSLFEQLTSPVLTDVESATDSLLSEAEKLNEAKSLINTLGSMNGLEWKDRSSTYLDQLSSILGWTEGERQRYSSQGKFFEVQRDFNDKSDKFTSKIKELTEALAPKGFDISSYKSIEELISALNNVEGDGEAAAQTLVKVFEVLASIAGLDITKLGLGFSGEDYKTPTDVVLGNSSYLTQASDRAKLVKIASNAQTGWTVNDLVGPGRYFKDNNEFQEFLKRNGNVADIFAEAQKNPAGTFGESGVNKLIQASGLANVSMDSNSALQYSKFKEFVGEGGELDFEALASFAANNPDFDAWVSGLEHLKDAVAGVDGATDKLTNDALAKYIEDMKVFGDRSDEVAAVIRAMNGDLEDQEAQLIKTRQAENQSAENNFLAKRFKEGARKGEVQKFLEGKGFTKAQIKKAKDIKNPVDEAQKEAKRLYDEMLKAFQTENEKFNQQLTDNFKAQAGEQGIAQLGEILTEAINGEMPEDLQVKGPDIYVEEGYVYFDASKFLEEFGDQLSEPLRIAAEEAAAKKLLIRAKAETKDGKTILADYEIVNSNFSKPSGGGGGGGKTAAQKAIEKAKHSTVELDHQLKIAEIQANKAQTVNDSKEYFTILGTEIDIYNKLGDVYRQNIADLEKQRSGLKDTEDDYWSLTEAINGYLESLEELGTKISEMNSKRIQMIESQQQINDMTPAHNRTMTQTAAQYAQSIEDYDRFRTERLKSIGQIADKRRQNESNILEWRAEYNKAVSEEGERSQNAINAESKINALEEENASLLNEALQALKEVYNVELQRLQLEIQRANQNSQFVIEVSSSREQVAAALEDYTTQRAQIADRLTARQNKINTLQSKLPELEENLKQQPEDSELYDQAFQAIQSVYTELGQEQLSFIQDREALLESFTTEFNQRFSRANQGYENAADLGKNLSEIYKADTNFDGYRESLYDVIELNRNLMTSTNEQLGVEQLKLSMLDEGTKEYAEQADVVKQLQDKYLNLTKGVQDSTKAIQQSYLEEQKLLTQRDTLADEAMIAISQTYAPLYKKNGQWEDYNGALDTQISSLSSERERNQLDIETLSKQIEEGIYSTPETLYAAQRQLSEYMRKDAEYESRLFNAQSEKDRATREQAEYNINKRSVEPTSISDMAKIFNGIFQSQMDFDSQIEMYDKSLEASREMRAIYADEIKPLYERIQRNDYTSEEDKINDVKAYENYLKLDAQEIAKQVSDKFAQDTVRFTQAQTYYNDSMRANNQRIALAQGANEIYLTDENFDKYRSGLIDIMDATRKNKQETEEYIRTLKKQLDTLGDNPAEYRKVTDAINEAEKTLMSYTKSIQDNTKAIEDNLLAQRRMETERANMSGSTNESLAGTYASNALNNWDYEGYRSYLAAGTQYAEEQLPALRKELYEWQHKIATNDFENEQAKQTAVQRINELTQQIAGKESTIESNKTALKKSYIDEIGTNTNIALLQPNYQSNIMNQWANRFASTGNYAGQRSALGASISANQQSIEIYRSAAKQLRYDMGRFDRATPEWYAAQQQLYEYNSQIQSLAIACQDAADAIRKSIIDELIRDYENATRGRQHNLEKAGTYAGMYNTSKMYDEYRNMLEIQTNYRESLMGEIDAQIAKLEAQLPSMKGSDQYDRIVDEIYKQQSEKDKLYSENIQALHDIATSKVDQALKERQTQMDRYDRQAKFYSLQASYYSEQMSGYDPNDPNSQRAMEAYTQALENQKNAIKQKQEAEKNNLAYMLELAKEIPVNTDAYEKLEQQIYASSDSIASMDLELIKLEKDMKNFELDKLFERLSRVDEIDSHKLEMVRTELGRYQNLGQLTNVNTMIGHENEQLEARAAHIQEYLNTLNAQLGTVEEGSDQYWRLASAIMKYEGELASTNATIEENTKKLEDNKKAILETRKTAEDAVEAEIKNRIQEQRDMLNGTTTTQDQILEIIRQSYRDRWEIYRKDREEQKKSLEAERSLLNERLNMRKNAINTERKQEELLRLQEQLALISSDTSRTKEAKELTKKISDLQQELALSSAEAETQARGEQISDQIQAIDDELSFSQDKLDEYLADANNFREIVDTLISGSFEELAEWVKTNDTTYKNSLDATRTEMLQSWEDTWKKMCGIIDTYWDQVEEIMSSAEKYMEFFAESTEYRTASDTGRQLILREAYDRYMNVVNAELDTAKYSHDDNYAVTQSLDDFKEWIFNLIDNVEGGERIEVKDYEPDKEYEKNVIVDTIPEEILDNTEWLEAVEEFQNYNLEAIEKFKTAVNEYKESDAYKALLEANEKVADLERQRDEKMAQIEEAQSKGEDVSTLADELSGLKDKISNETANRTELDTQFKGYLTTSMDEAFENAKYALNRMENLALDTANDLDTVIGEEGAEAYANAVELIDQNLHGERDTLESFVNDMDESTKSTVMQLYDNAIEGYDNQKAVITEMAEGIDATQSELAQNLVDTSTNATTSFTQTSEHLADNIADIHEKARLAEEESIANALKVKEFVDNYYADKQEKTLEEATNKAGEDLSETADSIKNSGNDFAKNSAEAILGFNKGVDEMKTTAENLMMDTRSVAGVLSTKIGSLVTSIDGQKEKIGTYLGNLDGYTKSVNDYAGALNGFAKEVKTAATKTEQLKKNVEDIVTSTTSALGTYQATMKELKTAIDGFNYHGLASEIVSGLSGSLKSMEEILKGKTKSGWVEENGNDKYYEEGSAVSGKWKKMSNSNHEQTWYRFDNEGNLVKNQFVEGNGLKYYVNEYGNMVTGWKQIEGKWYYFDGSPHIDSKEYGGMLTNTDIKAEDYDTTGKYYHVGSNGVWDGKTLVDENRTKKFASGGLVDYTGLAWVDGTKTKPESFLDAYDTQSLRMMMDAFNYVRQSPFMTRVDTASYGNTTNIGDVNVTINQAELKDDADYEEVARRVGQAFTKNLQKSGFNVARFDL